ncbi:hypothetical protein, partial [Mesorhizobium hawassense]|uniref:hypothetical protein n=1 Tax=Mesorhizobium hawassense TaxID=1209954 RepID=UPI001ABFBFFF
IGPFQRLEPVFVYTNTKTPEELMCIRTAREAADRLRDRMAVAASCFEDAAMLPFASAASSRRVAGRLKNDTSTYHRTELSRQRLASDGAHQGVRTPC